MVNNAENKENNSITTGPRKIRVAIFFIIILIGISPLCSVETHTKIIQKDCHNYKSMTQKDISFYYGADRIPDEVNDLGHGKIEIIYYKKRPNQNTSVLWSGYVIWFLMSPVIPLLIPTGHYQQSFVFYNGTLIECTNIGREKTGTPRFHI